MARRPEIGNVSLYPDRPLRADEKNGYVLKFYCPIRGTRVRRNTGTRDRRDAKRIQRECQERLLNGRYVESDGAITLEMERANVRVRIQSTLDADSKGRTWDECFEDYYGHRKQRGRIKSLDHSASRIQIAQRVLDADREKQGLPANGPIREYATLASLETLQEKLLAGEEGRYDHRAAMSVNTLVGAVTAFLRFCERHGWINSLPPLAKLKVDETMKGRPVSLSEFEAMLQSTPEVVGQQNAESWRFVLRVLWESAFRVADVMGFAWDDERRIHPVWPERADQFATLKIPSKQKNKKAQEIPMLPGLQSLLESVPEEQRHGWVVNPLPVDGRARTREDWFQPVADDLPSVARSYSNSAIARACGVSDTAVRKWLKEAGLATSGKNRPRSGDIPPAIVTELRSRAEAVFRQPSPDTGSRLSTEYVGRIISAIGEKARVVVQHADEETGQRIKYASAHDLRRGCAHRLINAGISAETLKIVLRHEDFKTTERFYGAVRVAQSAAAEIHEKLAPKCTKDELVGGLVGGPATGPVLSEEEVAKLKALLERL